MAYEVKKLPKSTVQVNAKIPWNEISKKSNDVFKKLQTQLEVEGFRKGHVPTEIAKKHLDSARLYEEALKELLPDLYQDVVGKEKLEPVMAPKIELAKAKVNEDWEVVITVALKPEIALGNYKSKIKELKNKSKKDEILVPGKYKTKESKQKEEENQQKLNEILTVVLNEVKI